MPEEPIKLELTVPAAKADVLRKCAELLSKGSPQAQTLEEVVSGELVAIPVERADSSEEA
jgi:hypothetical protein